MWIIFSYPWPSAYCDSHSQCRSKVWSYLSTAHWLLTVSWIYCNSPDRPHSSCVYTWSDSFLWSGTVALSLHYCNRLPISGFKWITGELICLHSENPSEISFVCQTHRRFTMALFTVFSQIFGTVCIFLHAWDYFFCHMWFESLKYEGE